MPRPGEEFHRLVEHLERTLADVPGITIESPKHLYDKVAHEDREFDIVITHRQPHREFIVAIECRDRGRKIGVEQVEGFHTKSENCGVGKRIIVSPKGFYAPALTKAAFYDIDCMTLAEFERFDWVTVESVSIYNRRVIQSQINIGLAESDIHSIPNPFKLFLNRADGVIDEVNIQTADGLPSAMMATVPQDKPVGGPYVVHLETQNVGDFFIIDADGGRHQLDSLIVHIEYDIVLTEHPIRCFSYGKSEGVKLEVAVADVEITPEIQGRISIMRMDDGTVRVGYYPTNPLPTPKPSI